MADKQVSWSPTIATWFRPLSPSAARFKERELSILNDPKAGYLPAVMREQTLRQYERYEKFPAQRLNQAREGYTKIADFIVRYVQAGGILRSRLRPEQRPARFGLASRGRDVCRGRCFTHAGDPGGNDHRCKAFRKDKDFGTVEPGKVADIIAVEGDPLKDVWTIQNVRMVVLGGKIIDTNFHADYKNPIPIFAPGALRPAISRLRPAPLPRGRDLQR